MGICEGVNGSGRMVVEHCNGGGDGEANQTGEAVVDGGVAKGWFGERV